MICERNFSRCKLSVDEKGGFSSRNLYANSESYELFEGLESSYKSDKQRIRESRVLDKASS